MPITVQERVEALYLDGVSMCQIAAQMTAQQVTAVHRSLSVQVRRHVALTVDRLGPPQMAPSGHRNGTVVRTLPMPTLTSAGASHEPRPRRASRPSARTQRTEVAQLEDLLTGDHTVSAGDGGREAVEHGGLARLRATGERNLGTRHLNRSHLWFPAR